MSVWTELQQGLSLAIGFEKADELVREARAEHAHELAEKQRAALEADPGILEPALINMIDPHCKDCRCLCHLADPSPCDDCREEADG